MSVHEVKITGTAAHPRIEFTCKGDRSADCRSYPDCGCETWDNDHAAEYGHPSVPHDRCWMQDWFDNDGIDPQIDTLGDVEYVVGMKGPIWTSFQEDYVEWGFVTEAKS